MQAQQYWWHLAHQCGRNLSALLCLPQDSLQSLPRCMYIWCGLVDCCLSTFEMSLKLDVQDCPQYGMQGQLRLTSL